MTIAKSRPWRAVLVGIILVVGVALALSQSRGAIVAAFVGVAVVGLAKSRALAVAIVSAGVAAAFVLYPAFIQWRLENESVTRYATWWRATASVSMGFLPVSSSFFRRRFSASVSATTSS